MRITVLGCWAPYPRPGGACSGYLLQDAGGNVLIDAGHGSFSHLTRFIHHGDLRAAVITHLHPDHYVDLHCLRHAVAAELMHNRRQRKVQLFIPSEPVHIFAELSACTDAFEIIPIESLPEEEVPPGVRVRCGSVGPVQFFFLPARHSLPAYSLGIEGSGYMVYSGDTAPTEELAALAREAGIFLCEASGQDGDEEHCGDRHMTARQAGALARQAKVKELIITHFFPEYDLEALRAQAGAAFGGRVELATEGDTYFLY
ncbi:MBL fold metallo-hydrolase [Desulfofundulus thermobenzoicus]|uniref:MBL fold metallo-hydrolase n=1 Tax=Desulfofundulus thermobenzoicus TaxID=29376 RepID=A0A6N7IMC5_9FIRM|nr:MBL fold metallo-hydrolase [Desulfofundulus thermobenzoicus]MQL51122.1 MBL fold metallo-hydrolase [Desulfofundulus thermobenzoicus]